MDAILETPTLTAEYTTEPGSYDEMCTGSDFNVQGHWRHFMNSIEKLGPAELERRQADVLRQLRENGVTYNVHGGRDHEARTWALDVVPMIIAQKDWAVIERGMMQRAQLLNLILSDIYGPRRLIKEGVLPMELIYSHAGFLRQCDDVTLPGPHQLIFYAADLARGPDGRMWVLGDRTQAPSGAGYALENRTVMTRVMGGIFRDSRIHRLSHFFRELQAALSNLAPRTDNPRVAVMTPGPHNETYFEHTYLASYLGYPLVQGDDLTVRDGTLSLKALEGLQPIDVIWRRVDDLYCDPLELYEDSRLGVAGLLEAARRQNVAIVNPLGSSVLENPALIPFLPSIARLYLGEELILPSAATWWCGQPHELNYVLDHADQLIIKRLSRQPVTRTIFGSELSKAELDTLRDEIKANPNNFVGQERVSFSTTPTWVDGALEARHAVLRSFAVGRQGSYSVMPGGLTRSASERGGFIVSNQAGGISKDTWVLTSKPQKHTSLWLQSNGNGRAHKHSHLLPSRSAENLFWVGRYAERTEATARLLRVIIDNVAEGDPLSYSDETEQQARPYLLRALTQVTMTYPGFVGNGYKKRLKTPEREIRAVALDTERVGTLLSNLRSMLNAAYTVRDLWSNDTWRVINDVEEAWTRLQNTPKVTLHEIQYNLNRLITGLMAFAGLNSESMTHEAGWLLLDVGRRLERALLTMALIRSTLTFKVDDAVCSVLLDAVLKTTENVITYRRRYRSHLQMQTVLDLLLLDDTNPRALLFQLEKLQTYIGQLPQERDAYRLSDAERLILQATTSLRLSDTENLTQIGDDDYLEQLDEFLASLADVLSQLSQIITQQYFIHTQSPHQLLASIEMPLTNGHLRIKEEL